MILTGHSYPALGLDADRLLLAGRAGRTGLCGAGCAIRRPWLGWIALHSGCGVCGSECPGRACALIAADVADDARGGRRAFGFDIASRDAGESCANVSGRCDRNRAAASAQTMSSSGHGRRRRWSVCCWSWPGLLRRRGSKRSDSIATRLARDCCLFSAAPFSKCCTRSRRGRLARQPVRWKLLDR